MTRQVTKKFQEKRTLSDATQIFKKSSQKTSKKKKKIKLIVSDLHLGLGRILEGGHVNMFEEFYFDEKFSELLIYYTSNKYENYNCELILNGDILNLLQVDYRSHFVSMITESISIEKTQRIIKGHPVFFRALKKFLQKKGNQITYIVGNHDQGVLWPGVRECLNKAVGNDIQYKNIVYSFDGVHIEHGHMYEAANRMNPKKFFIRKNLPEPVLNLCFGSIFFLEFVLKVKKTFPNIDKVRPFKSLFRWSLYHNTFATISALFTMILYLLKFVFYRGDSKFLSARKILRVFLESAVFPDLSSAAKRILDETKAHTIIFGHTHVYKHRQIEPNKEYFNTGTWTDLTSLDLDSLGKITKLTYVLLSYHDLSERPVGCLKEWHGHHSVEENVSIF